MQAIYCEVCDAIKNKELSYIFRMAIHRNGLVSIILLLQQQLFD